MVDLLPSLLRCLIRLWLGMLIILLGCLLRRLIGLLCSLLLSCCCTPTSAAVAGLGLLPWRYIPLLHGVVSFALCDHLLMQILILNREYQSIPA